MPAEWSECRLILPDRVNVSKCWAADSMKCTARYNSCTLRHADVLHLVLAQRGMQTVCLMSIDAVQELRASMNKSILQAERQLESSYVSAKAAAQKKWANANAEL